MLLRNTLSRRGSQCCTIHQQTRATRGRRDSSVLLQSTDYETDILNRGVNLDNYRLDKRHAYFCNTHRIVVVNAEYLAKKLRNNRQGKGQGQEKETQDQELNLLPA
jgi:hypothetical protein